MKNIFPLFLAAALWTAPVLQAEVPQRTDATTLNTSADRESAYRNRTFNAYLPLSTLTERLKVGNYSFFENPTGIYFSAGEEVVLTLEGAPRQPVYLIVYNFEKDGGVSEYELRPGANTLTITNRGLGYIHYRDANPDTAPAVRISIQGGRVNGVFTHKDTDETWRELLAGSVCGVLDILGERCQLVYDVESLRQACPAQGREMLEMYDRMIEIEQGLLGWDQFGCHPGNHIFGRVQWEGFMHADDLGAAFVNDSLPYITAPASLAEQAWGPAHEFGHVNQTRPGMAWTGVTEVTVNIFSTWVNYRFNPHALRLEHEVCPTDFGWAMRGGRFDCYINNALVKRQLWLYQAGPDTGVRNVPGAETGDFFVSACPLWQLQLYVGVALGNGNFYPRIFRKVRLQDDTGLTRGQMRVNFFLNACEAAQLDLSEFFVCTGILAPMNRMVDDYEPHMVTITPEMCQDALEKAAKYPKPDSSVIYYINGNNVEIFRKKLDVEPSPEFQVNPAAGRVEIPAGKWRNAVAFEAVDENGELLRVAILGFNHEDNTSTSLYCPPGTAAVRAVQWDGKRYDIWKK